MNLFFKFLILLLISVIGYALPAFPNKPYIFNIHKDDYKGENKNWSIGRDDRGFMYFGNDAGLLEFDGIKWNLNKLNNSPVVRSIKVLSHSTILTGGFEEFGRWDRDISGQLKYTSLIKHLPKEMIRNNDIWKICIKDSLVYFQSFSSIYVYDFKTVKKLPFDEGFLFLLQIRDELLVQKMGGAIYRIQGENLVKLPGSEIFSDTDVRVILPYKDNMYLIGTSRKGIYIYDGHEFRNWNAHLSQEMVLNELNCGILATNGNYFLGTILNGVYEVDVNGKILNHISSQNSIQNNTIHALFEDNQNNIWMALDRGLTYMQYYKNLSYYTDNSGNMGAVYDAVFWNDKLIIGTNQGAFSLNKEDLSDPNVLSKIKLINGTQGQVWSFNIVDNKLYCCHNKGLKEIYPDLGVGVPYQVGVGVFKLLETNIRGNDYLILSTYSAVKMVEKKTGRIITPTNLSESICATEIDHLGNIWLEDFYKGVYRCRLNLDLLLMSNGAYYGAGDSRNLPYNIKIFKVGGRIVFLGDNKFYTYDDINDQIIPNNELNQCFQNIKDIRRIVHIKEDRFWALSSKSLHTFKYDGYKAQILESFTLSKNLSLVNFYENVSILDDSTSLVCLDNGFLIHKQIGSLPLLLNVNNAQPVIESVNISNETASQYMNFVNEKNISYDLNTITLNFSSLNSFGSNLFFQYKLEGSDIEWSSPQKISSVTYPRLPQGKYSFQVRTIDGYNNYSASTIYSFEVMPPWYESLWAYLAYIVLSVVLFYLVWTLVLRRYRNYHLQRIRNRETRRLQVLANKLRMEVEQKDAELLTQTSFIIKKNELLLKIKEVIDEFYTKNKVASLLPLLQKITALLNNNLDSDEDWNTFLIKFEAKHTGFSKKLKSQFSELTNNDLRLCACLKLNMETKEIASLMNLSVRAIENNRYRLRKKLNLQPSQNLNEFLIHFE